MCERCFTVSPICASPLTPRPTTREIVVPLGLVNVCSLLRLTDVTIAAIYSPACTRSNQPRRQEDFEFVLRLDRYGLDNSTLGASANVVCFAPILLQKSGIGRAAAAAISLEPLEAAALTP